MKVPASAEAWECKFGFALTEQPLLKSRQPDDEFTGHARV